MITKTLRNEYRQSLAAEKEIIKIEEDFPTYLSSIFTPVRGVKTCTDWISAVSRYHLRILQLYDNEYPFTAKQYEQYFQKFSRLQLSMKEVHSYLCSDLVFPKAENPTQASALKKIKYNIPLVIDSTVHLALLNVKLKEDSKRLRDHAPIPFYRKIYQSIRRFI